MAASLQERYAALERDYSNGQWQAVLTASETLLQELLTTPSVPLRCRVDLLIGHTWRYGLGEPAAAAESYARVLASEPEAVVRAIAEQEWQQCQALLAAAAATAGATAGDGGGATATAAAGATAATTAGAAMPWLEALGGVGPATAQAPVEPAHLAMAPFQRPMAAAPSTTVEVIDEPEQIAVHLADPRLTTMLDLVVQPDPDSNQPSAFSPEDEAELRKGLLRVVLS